MKITLVELPPTLDGHLFDLPSRDIYSLFYLPSRAIDLLHGIIDSRGFTDVVTINPRFNEQKETLTDSQLNRITESDVVGISAITRTIPQSYELADLIRKINPRVRIIFGGPHVTALPEEALLHSDFVVRNEGDITFPALLERLQENLHNPLIADVEGISYKDKDGNIINNAKREFISCEQLSNQPFPKYSQSSLDKTNCFTINTSRGCPYECEFCSVVANFGKSYRVMNEDRTIDLIKYIISIKNGKYTIFFGDDNFAGNITRTKHLLNRIIQENIKMPRWSAQVRVESAYDQELLDLMKKTGCYTVYIGLESINEETLKKWNKKSNVDKIKSAIKNYHNAGIAVHGMFVFGSEYDTVEDIYKTVEFANEQHIDTVQLFSITPLPGTPLTERYENTNKILSKNWHLYSAQEVVVKPELNYRPS